jgi:hypothetical protein
LVENVYFLIVHSPYQEPGAPGPVNGLITHSLTLLDPDLPQPDAGRIYRCLTEFPGRTPGCLVPLSTLHYELDNGRLWSQVADWRTVVRALIALTRMPGRCESMLLVLDSVEAALLSAGPFAPVPPGLSIRERSQLVDMLTGELPEATGEPPLWPGDNLIEPPEHPATLPYQPHGT